MRSAFALVGFTISASTLAWGTSSDSSSSRFGISSTLRIPTPVRLPPGRARLATSPRSTGSLAEKTIGIAEVALFAACAAGGPPLGRDHIDIAGDELGGQRGQPVIATLRPAVFDRHVLSHDITGLFQPVPKSGDEVRNRCRRGAAKQADHGHRFLLCAGGHG